MNNNSNNNNDNNIYDNTFNKGNNILHLYSVIIVDNHLDVFRSFQTDTARRHIHRQQVFWLSKEHPSLIQLTDMQKTNKV